jgi:ADP-heptose:LPS heptosyltransferase
MKVYLDIIGMNSKNTDQSITNIVVVKTGSIGDFIIWINGAKYLRQIYPAEKFRLTLVCNCPPVIELLSGLNYFDEIVPVNDEKCHLDLSYRLNRFRELRRHHFDLAVNGDYCNSYRNDVMFIKILPRDTHKIGIKEHRGKLSWLRGNCFDEFISVSVEGESEMARYLGVISGIAGVEFKKEYPYIPVIKGDVKVCGEDYFVLFPGARNIGRRWPIENYVEIADRIYKNKNWKPIVLGGPEDFEQGQEIKELLSKREIPCENLAGKTSLLETVEWMRNAKIYLGNDTGGAHIANAVKTASFVLLGGGFYNVYFPYKAEEQMEGVTQTCIFYKMDCYNCCGHCKLEPGKGKTWPCLSNITVDSTWKIIIDKLNELDY